MMKIERLAAAIGIPAAIIAYLHAGFDGYRYLSSEISDQPVYEVELFFDHIDTLGGSVLQVGSSLIWSNDHTSFHSSIVTVKGVTVTIDPLTLSDAGFLKCQKKVASKFRLYSEEPPAEIQLSSIDRYEPKRLSPTRQTLSRGGRADIFAVPNKTVLKKDLIFSASSAPNFIRREVFACLAKVPNPIVVAFRSETKHKRFDQKCVANVHQYADNFLAADANTFVVRCDIPPSIGR
jgi:hypothetical protein